LSFECKRCPYYGSYTEIVNVKEPYFELFLQSKPF
jgi:ribosomal protein L9